MRLILILICFLLIGCNNQMNTTDEVLIPISEKYIIKNNGEYLVLNCESSYIDETYELTKTYKYTYYIPNPKNPPKTLYRKFYVDTFQGFNRRYEGQIFPGDKYYRLEFNRPKNQAGNVEYLDRTTLQITEYVSYNNEKYKDYGIVEKRDDDLQAGKKCNLVGNIFFEDFQI